MPHFNAIVGLPIIILKPGFDTALGGTITSVPGFLVLGLYIVWGSA